MNRRGLMTVETVVFNDCAATAAAVNPPFLHMSTEPIPESGPIGRVFCKGSVALGSGCMRCGRCAIGLTQKMQSVEEAAQQAHDRHHAAVLRLQEMRDALQEVVDHMLPPNVRTPDAMPRLGGPWPQAGRALYAVSNPPR